MQQIKSFHIENRQEFCEQEIKGCVILDVNVQRSSGEVEAGWQMQDYVAYVVDKDATQQLRVKVFGKAGVEKWVSLSKLYEHNPHFPKMKIKLHQKEPSLWRWTKEEQMSMEAHLRKCEWLVVEE